MRSAPPARAGCNEVRFLGRNDRLGRFSHVGFSHSSFYLEARVTKKYLWSRLCHRNGHTFIIIPTLSIRYPGALCLRPRCRVYGGAAMKGNMALAGAEAFLQRLYVQLEDAEDDSAIGKCSPLKRL